MTGTFVRPVIPISYVRVRPEAPVGISTHIAIAEWIISDAVYERGVIAPLSETLSSGVVEARRAWLIHLDGLRRQKKNSDLIHKVADKWELVLRMELYFGEAEDAMFVTMKFL
jgi:hypothetical protein